MGRERKAVGKEKVECLKESVGSVSFRLWIHRRHVVDETL